MDSLIMQHADTKTQSVSAAPAEGETYFDALQRAVADVPDEVFLDFMDGTVTYAEIDRASTRMAHALRELGVGAGQTVATILDSSADAIVIWFAVNRLGAIWVPVNTAYRGEFLRHQIADSLAQIVVCEDHYLANLAALSSELPQLRLVLGRGDGQAMHEIPGGIPVQSLDAHRGVNDAEIGPPPEPGDIACLIYTSGTTGRSKGCMISYNYLCNSARQQNIGIPPRPRETTWTCLPLFHVSASAYVVLATLIAQARARIVSRFSVKDFWFDIEKSGATTAMLMASMFPLLAQADDNEAMHRCRGRLRAVTGVPLTPADHKIWTERFGVPYMNSFGYGQTEASKICNHPYGLPLPPLGSTGPVSDDFEVLIADGKGTPVETGTVGEILVRPRRANIMFKGYWRSPEDTVTVWQDMWMHTGDMGRFDKDGILYFVDRKKDYVRSRGENISSIEVETALMRHASVSEVAFHAVASQNGGEDDLKITVVLAAQAQISEENLCRWAMEQLPHFAVPRFVEFRAALPKTPTGRVQKNRLREEGFTDGTWDAHAAGLIARRR